MPAVFRRNAECVVSETFEDDTVLINFEKGTYFSLQGSAPGIWQFLEAPGTLEMVAGAVRAVSGDVDYASALVNQVAQMGEPLYRKQEPTGYSNSSQEWLNSAGLLARMNFALQLADGKVPGVKVETATAGVSLGSPEFQRR